MVLAVKKLELGNLFLTPALEALKVRLLARTGTLTVIIEESARIRSLSIILNSYYSTDNSKCILVGFLHGLQPLHQGISSLLQLQDFFHFACVWRVFTIDDC